MKLRSGKVVNHTNIRYDITKKFNAYINVNNDNYPDRLKLIHEIFMIIHENIEIMMKPDFSPNKELSGIIYGKTFSLENESYSALEKYTSKIYEQNSNNREDTIRNITQKTHNFCKILINVRAQINKKILKKIVE
jgi:hypothetical protein